MSEAPLDPTELLERALADFGEAIAVADFASAERCIRVAVAVVVIAPTAVVGAQ